SDLRTTLLRSVAKWTLPKTSTSLVQPLAVSRGLSATSSQYAFRQHPRHRHAGEEQRVTLAVGKLPADQFGQRLSLDGNRPRGRVDPFQHRGQPLLFRVRQIQRPRSSPQTASKPHPAHLGGPVSKTAESHLYLPVRSGDLPTNF